MEPNGFSLSIADSFRTLSLDEIMDERTKQKLDSQVPINLKNLASIKSFQNLITTFLKMIPLKHHQNIEKFIQDLNNKKQTVEKNSAKSIAFRKEGNKMYGETNSMDGFIEVIRVYNQSIAYAPNKSEELALSYANRAMVLFRLKHFKKSLEDINRALGLNYPAKTTGKLLVKRIRCMKIINHPDLHVIYNDSLKWVDEHAENDQQLKIDIKNAYEQQAEPYSASINTQFRDDFLEEMKKSCPDLKKIEIRRDTRGDLALFATTDIHVGEVVAVQKTYTQILRMQKPYVGCWQCLVMCLNPVPCDYCTIAMYCSESCKAEAWNKHHECECNLTFLLQSYMSFLQLPVRICMFAMKQLGGILPLMKEVWKMSQTKDMKDEHRIVDGKYPSDLYRNVYYMSNKNPIPVDLRYFNIVLNISMFVYYIATRTNLFDKKYQGEMFTVMEEREPKFFASLILRHYVMLQHLQSTGYCLVNDISIKLTPVCPLLYMMSHSCNPNTSKILVKDHQIITAIDEIRKGQIINFSFNSSVLADQPEAERSSVVLKTTGGPCKCGICILKNSPIVLSYTELEPDPDKCRKITNALYRAIKTDEKHKNGTEPETGIEFHRQMNELFRMFRSFFAVAPPFCSEVIAVKNMMMKRLTFDLNSKIYNFDAKKRADSRQH